MLGRLVLSMGLVGALAWLLVSARGGLVGLSSKSMQNRLKMYLELTRDYVARWKPAGSRLIGTVG